VLLSPGQLTGCDDSHLVFREQVGLLPECWQAFDPLREQAAKAGFDLCIASGFRSFERQLAIWNAKALGQRAVHDDAGQPVAINELNAIDKIHAILRYSALPGASRHHWGSDLDVYDAAAMPEGYQLQLSPGEVADTGMFGPLHLWLDEWLQRTDNAAFFRPYASDLGGIAPERWHLSFRPCAENCQRSLGLEQLQQVLLSAELELKDEVLAQLPELYRRYVSLICD
jgi:LAS superfamily LD-carboxypeptidase LdcB